MMKIDRLLLRADLIRDEDKLLFVYDDATGKPIVPGYTCVGHPTIGVGRALDVTGITSNEADYLVTNNEEEAITDVEKNLPWVISLTEPRQRVLVEMTFNMGIKNLLQFHDTLRYIEEGRYQLAGKAMLDSLWAKQVGERAERLVTLMING